MKIIKNNVVSKSNEYDNQNKTVKIICDSCSSELEIGKEDTHIGYLGACHITCPCCNSEVMVEGYFDDVTLTKDNIDFPLHFIRTNKNMSKTAEITSIEIEDEIRTAINYFRKHKNEECWYTSYGDLYMVVDRSEHDGDYHIVVTKDFYETFIPFEDEDC